MFRKEIIIGPNTYVELASRMAENTELLGLTLRGIKPNKQVSLASVLLTREEAEKLKIDIEAWLAGLGQVKE